MAFTDRYKLIDDLPARIPVFPLAGALLLPRAELPLNIFEPRYLEMVEDTLSGERLIGMIQPDPSYGGKKAPPLLKMGCAGRITAFAETPDNRILMTLSGVCRFTIIDELDADTPYRQVIPDFRPFAADLVSGHGSDQVNRPAVIKAFRDYLEANNMSASWNDIDAASTEVLVNTLSQLAPYPVEEKQALLEAPDLKTRADVLVALTEMAISKTAPGGSTLQ
jgi:Lon protease-like protein